ncbi:PilZ domain-containing protein [Novosphingobium sp. B 225]|uniref:PilZ domain-containing protein n=1 Tax=Novosphingobium sp. B 225 TaxID=1961849 RepID=UPI000B4AB8BF
MIDIAVLPLSRCEGRWVAECLIEARGAHPVRSGARVSSLSATGCNVRHEQVALRAGQFVELHFSNIAAVSGLVRWSRGRSIGIEFLRLIDQRTFKLLGNAR